MPFIVAFGLIGLVMSVLIVGNVVSGAVAAGTRRIGVLKSIGFSPGQVVAAYLIQVAVPALAGCVAGVLVGNLLSVPLLGQTAQVYGVGALAVPFWVDLAVPLAMLGLTGAAALAPSVRAARLSAVQAIATGRAPRASGGYAAHRLLGRVQPAAPAGDDRAGRAVRAAGQDPGHAGRHRVRRGRGDVRGGPGHLPGPGRGRPVARGGAGTGLAGGPRGPGKNRAERTAPAPAPPACPAGRAGARGAGRAAGPARHAALRGRSRRPDQRPRPGRPAVS